MYRENKSCTKVMLKPDCINSEVMTGKLPSSYLEWHIRDYK